MKYKSTALGVIWYAGRRDWLALRWYLAACVVYATLYGKSPVGNSYDYYGRIDKATTAFLQKVAAETLEAFQVR